MIRCRAVLCAAGLVLLFSGCGEQAKPPPTPVGGAPVAGKPDEKKASRPSGVMGVYNREKNRRVLHDIGLACLTTDISKLPRTVDELKEIIKDNPLARKAVESGEFVMVSNAKVAGDSLFLYERDPDQRGNRLVLMGSGGVEDKTAEEFAPDKATGCYSVI